MTLFCRDDGAWGSRFRSGSLVAAAVVAVVGLVSIAAPVAIAAEESVDFNRDILPLLSENCFQCHGPDEAQREAGLRLDRREQAFAELESGEPAIVPGAKESSLLFERISSSDPEERMPPVESGKRLDAAAIARIGNWIDDGAEWSGHWAFQTPRKGSLPAPVEGWPVVNAIDQFIQAVLPALALSPEPPANKETLIRRVSLELTGLPPTVTAVDHFLADASPQAYERVVDRLLSSPRYGEHMARSWLDAARYGDTHGLHLDNERSIWLYRDWVIEAFNRNLPFDQFTIHQLAGDLLPDATLQHRVATGFNRCNVTTGEGGTIDEEYYVRYAVDRVETTATVWMGLTAGCAACHDHKFDPLTQKNFYQLFSYFFSLTEKALDGNVNLPPPSIKVPTPQQSERKGELQAELASLQQEIEAVVRGTDYVDRSPGVSLPPLAEQDLVWFDDQLPSGAEAAGDGQKTWHAVSAPEHPVFSGQTSFVRTADQLSQDIFTKATESLKLAGPEHLFAYVYLDPTNPPETIQLQFHDKSWEHRAYWGATADANLGQAR